MVAGIYKITCLNNGLFYIGQTVCFYERFANHRSDLNSDDHHNVNLQKDWNVYGEKNFIFEIVEEVPLFEDKDELEDHLIQAEQEWLDQTESWKRGVGYNILPFANSGVMLGRRHTEETKQKMRENHPDVSGSNHPQFGKPKSNEIKEKIRKSKIGQKHTEETKIKIKNKSLGRTHTEKTKQKISSRFSGDQNWNVKLTWEQVREIRYLYSIKSQNSLTMKKLGEMFGVSKSCIQGIIENRRWKE